MGPGGGTGVQIQREIDNNQRKLVEKIDVAMIGTKRDQNQEIGTIVIMIDTEIIESQEDMILVPHHPSLPLHPKEEEIVEEEMNKEESRRQPERGTKKERKDAEK